MIDPFTGDTAAAWWFMGGLFVMLLSTWMLYKLPTHLMGGYVALVSVGLLYASAAVTGIALGALFI